MPSSRKINCEICEQTICIKYYETHINSFHTINSNEFTIEDMKKILSLANKYKYKEKEQIFNIIKEVLNDEIIEFKKIINSNDLIMDDFYIEQFKKKIDKEKKIFLNIYDFFQKYKIPIDENINISNKKSFKDYIIELRKNKYKKKKICILCCKYYRDVKWHIFYLHKQNTVINCIFLNNLMINNDSKKNIFLICDLLKYCDKYYEKISQSNLISDILNYIKTDKINFQVKTNEDIYKLIISIRELTVFDNRKKMKNEKLKNNSFIYNNEIEHNLSTDLILNNDNEKNKDINLLLNKFENNKNQIIQNLQFLGKKREESLNNENKTKNNISFKNNINENKIKNSSNQSTDEKPYSFSQKVNDIIKDKINKFLKKKI